MTEQELLAKISAADQALTRSIQALKQASERYLATFPQNVKDRLPAYADAKSNVSAAYYMYPDSVFQPHTEFSFIHILQIIVLPNRTAAERVVQPCITDTIHEDRIRFVEIIIAFYIR